MTTVALKWQKLYFMIYFSMVQEINKVSYNENWICVCWLLLGCVRNLIIVACWTYILSINGLGPAQSEGPYWTVTTQKRFEFCRLAPFSFPIQATWKTKAALTLHAIPSSIAFSVLVFWLVLLSKIIYILSTNLSP